MKRKDHPLELYDLPPGGLVAQRYFKVNDDYRPFISVNGLISIGKPWIDINKFIASHMSITPYWGLGLEDELRDRHHSLLHFQSEPHYGETARDFSMWPHSAGLKELKLSFAIERALALGFIQIVVPDVRRDMAAEGQPLKYVSQSKTESALNASEIVLTDDPEDARILNYFFLHKDGSIFRMFESTIPGVGLQATFEVLSHSILTSPGFKVDPTFNYFGLINGLSSICCKYADGVMFPAGSHLQHGIATSMVRYTDVEDVMKFVHTPVRK